MLNYVTNNRESKTMAEYKQEIVKTALNDNRMALYGERSDNGTAKLFFAVTSGGNPGILVFPNDPSDNDGTPIRAAMNIRSWFNFVNSFKEVANSEGEAEIRISNKAGAISSIHTDSTTIIKKDAEGKIKLMVLKDGRPKKPFTVTDEIYTEVIGKSENITERELYRLSALSYIESVNNWVTILMNERYKPYEGTNKSSGGGDSKSTSSMDDEISF